MFMVGVDELLFWDVFVPWTHHFHRFFFYRTKLIEIGKFEATKDLGQYDIGQVKINHFTIFTSYIDLLYLFVH